MNNPFSTATLLPRTPDNEGSYLYHNRQMATKDMGKQYYILVIPFTADRRLIEQ